MNIKEILKEKYHTMQYILKNSGSLYNIASRNFFDEYMANKLDSFNNRGGLIDVKTKKEITATSLIIPRFYIVLQRL